MREKNLGKVEKKGTQKERKEIVFVEEKMEDKQVEGVKYGFYRPSREVEALVVKK